MKAIALLIVLITLAIGTYLNRPETSATNEDTVQTGLAAPERTEVIPKSDQKSHLEYPEKTNIPL